MDYYVFVSVCVLESQSMVAQSAVWINFEIKKALKVIPVSRRWLGEQEKQKREKNIVSLRVEWVVDTKANCLTDECYFLFCLRQKESELYQRYSLILF